MLVIYRTNEGFEGDVVTVMSGDAELTAALTGEDAAVLDIALAASEAAALVMNPEKYVVRGVGKAPTLCERKDAAEALKAVRAETVVSAVKLAVAGQVTALADIDEKAAKQPVVDVVPAAEEAT